VKLSRMYESQSNETPWDAAIRLMEQTIHGRAVNVAEEQIEEAEASGTPKKLQHAREVHRIVKELCEVECRTLAKYGEVRADGYRNSQMHTILMDWFPRLRLRARDRGDVRHYWEIVSDADRVLRDIRAALFAGVEYASGRKGDAFPLGSSEKEDEGRLWRSPGTWQMDHQPANWESVSPVDRYRLTEALAEYLKRDWLQHNLIDSAAINALLFDEIARAKDTIRSGTLVGKWNWAYILAGNHKEKLLLWTVALMIGAFVARWVIPAVVVVGLIRGEYFMAAQIVGVVWALYAAYRIATWPSRRRDRQGEERKQEKWEQILYAMAQAWQHSDNKVIHPTRLKELVVSAETKGAILPPVIHSLLDRAIQRDATMFIRPDFSP
jgi:hypothetical protein